VTLMQLLNRTVTITRRTASASTDDYGNEISAETNVATVGELQQTQRTEPTAQGELAVTTWLLILPAGTNIDTGDTVTVDTHTYEVIGSPWQARNPRTQVTSHVEATLRRSVGSEETGS
jgi:hypothetical protein